MIRFYELDFLQKKEYLAQLVKSHLNSQYKYYFCTVNDDFYKCCFSENFTYKSAAIYVDGFNYYQINSNVQGKGLDSVYETFGFTKNSGCGTHSSSNNLPVIQYINPTQHDIQTYNFTNFALDQHQLIDLVASVSSPSTPVVDGGGGGSLNSSNIDILLILISAILMLIFLTGFIRSCFFKR